MLCKASAAAFVIVSALLLILLYRMIHNVPSPKGSPARPTFHLQLVVLTADRPDSLERLLASIRAAHYDGDDVTLRICADFPRNASRRPEHEACVRAAKGFTFAHGAPTVVVHARNVGMYAQWYDCWQQTDRPGHYAVIIEDDLELSPFFYRWLKAAVQFYADDASVFSVALQRGGLVARDGTAKDICSTCADPVFAYRLFASLGAAPLPRHWRPFREWVHTVSQPDGSGDFVPYVPNETLITNKWVGVAHVQRRTMPTSYLIYYMWQHGLYTVYPRLPGHSAFVCDHREIGMNFQKKVNTTGICDSSLVSHWDPEYIKFPRRPVRIGWDGIPELRQD
ncbi:PREDICTED: uncharacterized protein LOC106817743 [Priapulus caudatus]|uniref:Uncharacterized protein LOC106817743 n=1 Tax=Priapulus caudatus TaxID=37621 RepID=A0ABM1F0E2_PRICU|nr:PREDICTED: uncharacterized protein LOC106817743 [Priapulus caudatus]